LNFYALYLVLSVGNYDKGFFSCDNEHKFRNVCVKYVQGGSNMTRTDLYVNKPHCAAAVRP